MTHWSNAMRVLQMKYKVLVLTFIAIAFATAFILHSLYYTNRTIRVANAGHNTYIAEYYIADNFDLNAQALYIKIYHNNKEVLYRHLGHTEYPSNSLMSYLKIGYNGNYKYATANKNRYIMLLDYPNYIEYVNGKHIDPIVFIYDTMYSNEPSRAYCEPSTTKHLQLLSQDIDDIIIY
jgi:hypothetical protein